MKVTLRDRAEPFKYYSLAPDESTDKRDTAQLAVFVWGVNHKFHVTKELVRLVPLKESTGADVLEAISVTMNDIGLKPAKLYGMTTYVHGWKSKRSCVAGGKGSRRPN